MNVTTYSGYKKKQCLSKYHFIIPLIYSILTTHLLTIFVRYDTFVQITMQYITPPTMVLGKTFINCISSISREQIWGDLLEVIAHQLCRFVWCSPRQHKSLYTLLMSRLLQNNGQILAYVNIRDIVCTTWNIHAWMRFLICQVNTVWVVRDKIIHHFNEQDRRFDFI